MIDIVAITLCVPGSFIALGFAFRWIAGDNTFFWPAIFMFLGILAALLSIGIVLDAT